MRLGGKSAIITGAARGIGYAITEQFVQAGASVVLADIDGEAATAAAQALSPDAAIGVACDVTRPEDAHRVIATAKEHFGAPDILVCNAGIVRPGAPIEDIAPETWEMVLGVNLMGCVHPTAAFAPIAKRRGSGRIIYMSSVGGQVGGVSAEATYAVSKSSVLGLTKAVARQLSPHGVTVNAVAPGAIRTDMTDILNYPPSVREGIPLGDFGQPSDIAAACLYLASEDARYVTGATLDVNGGIFMR